MSEPWFKEQPELATLVRERRLQGASYRDLQAMLFASGVDVPVDSLRRIFHEQGWNKVTSGADALTHQKERIGVLQDRARFRAELGGTARWQYFVDALERSITERVLDPLYPLPLAPVAHGPSVYVMPLLGDVHTGQYVQAAEVGTRLAYGPDEFTDRMELWTTGVIDHLDHLSRFATIEHVALVGLGDYIENAQMREGSARYTHETTAEAVVRFCEELLNALERLITRHPHYRYSLDFKNGNHDRIGRKGEGHPWESYGTIIAAYVKRGMADYTNLTVTGHTEDATLFQLGRNQILVTHGQQAQGGTLPFAAIERLSERYAGFTRNQHQFLVVGHYHHGARWTANNGVECILNPAFAETSSFSSGLGLASPAGQKVLTFLAEGGLYCDHTIPLSDAPIASITPHIRGAAA